MIGSIKDLKQGDTITYTTVYGTRTYMVETVKIISNTDWSYLQSTADNRITLTTCLANHPESRVVVQVVEKKINFVESRCLLSYNNTPRKEGRFFNVQVRNRGKFLVCYSC